MLRKFKVYLDAAKSKLRDLFYQHGKLCATHPLVVLSLAFTVINTCSAPAIWAFFYNPSSVDRFWEFGGSAVPVDPGLVLSPGSNVISIEQIIIETSLDKESLSDKILDPGSLNTQTLKLAHFIQKAISKVQASLEYESEYNLKDICLKLDQIDDCLVFSPLEFWNNELELLEADDSLAKTASKWVINSTMGFSIPAWSVFNGIYQGKDPRSFHGAKSLQITYFLKPPNTLSSGREPQILWERLWEEVLKEISLVVGDVGELSLVSNSELPGQTKFTLLELTFSGLRFSTEVLILSLGYLSVVIYMFFSMSRFKLVKSKFWLGFAAVLILNVSLLMSFGICLFFGLELALIPWKVVPFLIIAVGSENVLRITQAVVSTSLDLPVRERVGEGVRNCCIGVTWHLGIELSILGASIFSPNPALKEFGIFGALAVVIDYLLQLTFFVAVLSIDIRRLELSDLQELKNHTTSENKKVKAQLQDSDESLLLANIWESMVSQIEKLKSYSFIKFLMVGLSLLSAIFISKQLRQTTVFSYPQGLELSGIDFPYQSQLDGKFWELLNPSHSELYLEIRPAKKLTFVWSPAPEKLARLTQPSQTYKSNSEFVRKPTPLTLLLLLATGGCITMYLNILSKGRRKEKAHWQSLDPRKSIRTFKGLWADVLLLESNGQELVAALSLDNELVVWNYHISRVVWHRPGGILSRRISCIAISTHGWLVCSNTAGSVEFFYLETSYHKPKPNALILPGAAPVSRMFFLPDNQNLIVILSGERLLIYDFLHQKQVFSSDPVYKVTCVHALMQVVFAGLVTGEILAISLETEDSDPQLSFSVIATSTALPIKFLEALDLDGRNRALLIGFQNSDCEVRMLSDTHDLRCHISLPLPDKPASIIGLSLISAPDGFIAVVSFPTHSQITHLSHRNASGTSPPISPGNFSLRITCFVSVPSVGCSFTYTRGKTLIGLSRVSDSWELWGICLSHGSLEDAVKNRLRFPLVCDPIASDIEDSDEGAVPNKIHPWVPFGFVSLPFVPLSENRGLGMALGNYVFCVNPHLLLSSQE